MKELSGIAPCGVPEEQLYNLLGALEKNEDEHTIQQLLHSNPTLRAAIARGIQHDDLHEWLLDPWIPWWMPLWGIKEDTEEEGENEFVLADQPTLDPYIVSLPPLSSLRTAPCVDLQFNVLQVLFATAWTLRLYYGLINAKENAEQAVETLLTASSVLTNNHVSFDSLPAVLTHCVTTCTLAKEECNASWTDLMNDVWRICENKRFVLKCLLEAKMMVKQAAALAKQQQQHASSDNHDPTEKRSMLRRIGKKIDFYASWCNAHYHQVGSLVPDIRDWIEQWSSDESKSILFRSSKQETFYPTKNKSKERMIRFHQEDFDDNVGSFFVEGGSVSRQRTQL